VVHVDNSFVETGFVPTVWPPGEGERIAGKAGFILSFRNDFLSKKALARRREGF
jgi:hypothetical protein